MPELGVDPRARRARAVFLAAWVVVLVARIGLAAVLDLFGDEAYYAWQGERLAAAFSDLPPATAALAAAGRSLDPSSPLALRLPFLLLASLIPWLVVAWSRRFTAESDAWRAGTAAMLLPLFWPVGILALPEALLAVLTLALALAATRALERGSPADWLALGLVLASGLQTHHRFLIPAAGLGLALLLHARGRAALRGPWPWIAALIALASSLPAYLLEREVFSASLAFQFADRHPWRFGLEGLWHLPLQAVLCTPLIWLMVWIGLIGLRERRTCDPATAVLIGIGLFPVLLFAVLAPFVDQARTSLHWPFPAFLVLLPAAFADWRSRWRTLRIGAFALMVAGSLVACAYLVAASSPRLAEPLAGHKAFPEAFVGWRELRRAAAERLAARPFAALLADNVLLGAQLAFEAPPLPLFVLDHPRNAFHGRAVQLRRWGVDEGSFRRSGRLPALLVVEDEATPFRGRLAHYRSLCRLAPVVRWEDELVLSGGRRRFLFFVLDRGAAECRLPPLAYIDQVARPSAPGGTLCVEGWAIREFSGVPEVGLLLDGHERARARVDRPAPQVLAQWPFSQDPRHPRVGFRIAVALSPTEPRPRRIGLRLHGPDGWTRDFPEQAIEWAEPATRPDSGQGDACGAQEPAEGDQGQSDERGRVEASHFLEETDAEPLATERSGAVEHVLPGQVAFDLVRLEAAQAHVGVVERGGPEGRIEAKEA
jgi:4-amino-4-deoxy-L-arabinose transferase-like glycosyltransferase